MNRIDVIAAKCKPPDGECEAVCPKEISIDFIARMNRDYIAAKCSRRSAAE